MISVDEVECLFLEYSINYLYYYLLLFRILIYITNLKKSRINCNMNYIYAKTQHNTYENHQAEITPIDHIIFAVDETAIASKSGYYPRTRSAALLWRSVDCRRNGFREDTYGHLLCDACDSYRIASRNNLLSVNWERILMTHA